MQPANGLKGKAITPFSTIYLLLFSFFLVAGCSKEVNEDAPSALHQENTSLIAVQAESPDVVVKVGTSIQAAVDAAAQGSVIAIEPGVYREAIVVSKPGIKLIGRGAVIIENPGGQNNGIRVTDEGDNFTLSHVTIKGFERNGIILVRVKGYLLSHVTAIDNGAYGIFPIRSENGIIEYCTVSGHSDTGIYIGQSNGAELNFNTAFENVNGIEVENCTNIVVNKNQCYDNVAGILVALLPGLTVKELSGIQIIHNHVFRNNHVNFAPPGGFEAFVPSGSGILVVGADNSLVENNNVHGNNFAGIAVVSSLVLGSLAGLPPAAFADIEPFPDGVKVMGNEVMNNGAAPPTGLPLPGVDLLWDGSGTSNCWTRNNYKTPFPQSLPVCM